MGCTESKELSAERIVEGLKAALNLAASETVKKLSAAGGFNNNAALHIPLPGTLGEVLEKVKVLPGLGDKVQELENKMNEAAEAAAGACLHIFTNTIGQINFNDAKAILQGADDAATKVFRELLGPQVLKEFTPIIDAKMAELGVVTVFNAIMHAYENIPFIGKKVEFPLSEHVVTKAFEGLWVTLAEFEKAVRHTPALQQQQQVLVDVFGQKAK